MASYRIEFRRSAEKDLRRLDRSAVPRTLEAIQGLAINPLPPGCKKLLGSEQTYRIRVGDYRVVFQVDHQQKIVTIERVRHRREVYRT